jgi:hypothetical protein
MGWFKRGVTQLGVSRVCPHLAEERLGDQRFLTGGNELDSSRSRRDHAMIAANANVRPKQPVTCTSAIFC